MLKRESPITAAPTKLHNVQNRIIILHVIKSHHRPKKEERRDCTWSEALFLKCPKSNKNWGFDQWTMGATLPLSIWPESNRT